MPKAVTVTLAASSGGSYATQPAIARQTLDPNPAGAYVARLSFADLPPGEYEVTTRVGNAEVAGDHSGGGARAGLVEAALGQHGV